MRQRKTERDFPSTDSPHEAVPEGEVDMQIRRMRQHGYVWIVERLDGGIQEGEVIKKEPVFNLGKRNLWGR